MNPRPENLFPFPHRPLDALVRRQLDRDDSALRPVALLNRVLRHRPTRRLALGLPAAVAAALVVALFAVQPGGRAQARPAEVVEQARQVHAQPLDREYLIQTEFAPAIRQRFPRLTAEIQERLWSRGDRFYVEARPGQPAWGRDELGRVWFAFTPKTGARFDADEIPRSLQEIATVRNVELSTLLSEVLRKCILVPVDSSPAGEAILRIEATPYPGKRPNLESATLDIDRTSGVVKRLVLKRRLFGQSLATVTLTYVGSRPQSDQLYELEGHLAPEADVYERDRSSQRLRILIRHQLGPLLRPAR